MRLITLATAWIGAAWGCLAAQSGGAWLASAWLPAEAQAVLAIVQTNNPQIEAAGLLRQAEAAQAQAHDGFYQPRLSVSAGGGQGPVGAPESTLVPRLGGDAAGIQAGLLVPLRAGAYLGAGAAQRYLFDADGFEDLGQSVAGVRIEVPLLQNRGFRSQRFNQEAMDATAAAAAAQARSVARLVAREALAHYAAWLYAAADVRESLAALTRVERLLEETSGRVELETVAEYQVFAAQMEVRFRQEELRQSHTLLAQAGQALETRLGGVAVAGRIAGDPALLRAWASRCATSGVEQVFAHAGERPERLRAREAVVAAERLREAVREGLRSNLALQAGVGFQAEDAGGGFGRDALLDDDRVGVEVALVWSRPLGFDAEEARLRAQQARLDAARAGLREVELLIVEEQARAREAVEAARERLGIVDLAVEDARRALVAEEQRLSLGEGRSRNVLDAQKDLTTAERRANVAAYDLILAYTDLLAALGVPLIPAEVLDGLVSPTP